jgi:hypothetical protein
MIGKLLCVLGSVGLLATPAGAADGARNLVATPSVKAALRTAFLHAHPKLPPAKVAGPLKGRTYYGSYRGREYALAVFSIPRFGTTDQPELFRRPAGGAWRDLGDTGGDVCPPYVPLPLIKVWRLKPAGSGCYY